MPILNFVILLFNAFYYLIKLIHTLMATLKNGKGAFIGKLGNTVSYWLNGKLVRREIGITNKLPSVCQSASRQITSIVSKFLAPLKEYINIGFELEGKQAKKNPNNMASSFNRKFAIKGEYPDQKINFPKVLLSKGKMPPTKNVAMNISPEGLVFTWDTAISGTGIRWSDQVMMMGYMPDLQEATYVLNGAKRLEGKDLLQLPRTKEGVWVETYISFVAANRKSVSNSIYTGRVFWEGI